MANVVQFGVLLVATTLLAIVVPAEAPAQQSNGLNPGRDCQTVRTCNFSRSGSVRGCLSSYTCRTCRAVPARCAVAGNSDCHRFVCSWGG